MKRVAGLLLGLLLAAGAQADYAVRPQPLGEGVWVLVGSTEDFAASNGGNVVNVAFIVTGQGVLVIDSGPSRRYGEALRRAIAEVTDEPLLKLFLTHHHPDHVLGNQAFAGVPIAALPGTRERLAEQGDGMAENMYRLIGDWMRGTEVVLPDEAVQPGRACIAGRCLQLLALTGHSGADLAILDETSGVLFAGDLLFHQRAPTTPNTPDLASWLADLERLEALPWTRLVPGHGPVSEGPEPIRQTRDYLRWLDQLLREGAMRGADMNELMASPIPPSFGNLSLTRYELIRSVNHLYPTYERAVLQRLD